jgi:methionyl-tRNA formyltransferase
MVDITICLAGKNRIAVDALLFMIELGWTERLVVCPNKTDDGISSWQPSLLRFAKEFGVEVITLDEAKKIKNLIFISLEFDQIISPSEFQSRRLYNIHFSALPAYKGMYTSAIPILKGAETSGVTLHEIDHGIDTGAIIAQDIFNIPSAWTARNLYFKYLEAGFGLFCRKFEELVADSAPVARPQPARGASYYSKSSIDYKNISVNLNDVAEGIVRQLRAFSFREYQTPMVEDMEVGDWDILPHRSFKRPGTILERGRDYVILSTIDYDLRLERSRIWEWFSFDADSTTDDLDRRYVNIADKTGWTPLIRAAYAGDEKRCRRLLEAGADPNEPNMNGTTPLMYACSCVDAAKGRSVMKLLLEFGADPKRADRFGRPLCSYHPTARVGLST